MSDDSKEPVPLPRSLNVMRGIWAVDRAARHLSRMMEQHLGLSGPQRLVVRVVGQNPGISAGALAAILHLDASTLTGHLQHLEEEGVLERKASVSDGRRAHVSLTVKGKKLDVATPGTVEAAVEAALKGTSAKSIGDIEKFLGSLVQELEQQADACETKGKKRAARK
jgi:DNA-binding MarR family transcriptional regulator